MINGIIEKQLIDMGSVAAKEAKKAFDSKAVEDVIKQAIVDIAFIKDENISKMAYRLEF